MVLVVDVNSTFPYSKRLSKPPCGGAIFRPNKPNKRDQWFGECQDANGLRLSGPLSRLMDFITNPDMARAMRKFLRTGGLRFVRAVLLCGSHVRLYGRLSLTGGLRLRTGGSHLRFLRTGGLRFLRTGGLRFVRPSCAASGHGFVRPLPYGRLSFAALICGFHTGS